ncbi:MAG: ribonuclease T2 family protein [Hyphomicrobiaceae bacterium]
MSVRPVLCLLFAIAVCVVLTNGAIAQRAGRDGGDHVAGRFSHYQLVLSWSPTHCEDNSRGRNDTQCGPRRARPYAFVLHGLWPQYERGYPEFCKLRRRPFVPDEVIRSMMNIMPSKGLIIHQYRKHGTCSGYTAADYYKASRLLFNRVRIPARYKNARRVQFATPEELVAQFVEANPGLEEDMVKVVCKRGGSNRLREVRICFDKKGRFRTCGRVSKHQCRKGKMYIPPAR